jgi:hypothetical protein
LRDPAELLAIGAQQNLSAGNDGPAAVLDGAADLLRPSCRQGQVQENDYKR